MEYKLIALDLDDSLLDDNQIISEKNKKAIIEFQKKGIHVVFCSGRANDSMMPFVEELGVHNDEDYIISYNGALINTISGTQLLRKEISGKILKDIIKTGRKHNIDIQLYTDDLLIEKRTERTELYESLCSTPATKIDDLTKIKSSMKVLFNYMPGDKLEALRLDLIKKYGEELNIFYSKPSYVEVLNKEANKGLAVKTLADKLGIKKEEIIAIGDGFNDVSMIEYAGLGVAVQNSPDGVKEIADYITKATNNEDATWEVYEKFVK